MMSEIKRLLSALLHSYQGLRSAFKHETAFRVEVILCCVGIALAFILRDDMTDRLWLVTSLLLMLIVEVINSAIETLVDRISLQKHALSKRAKDLGSAAVLLTVIYVLFVWGTVFLTGIHR